ncbi:type II secretion system F family protein [Methylotenera mobilis]|uniref:Type II secretion system protein n=1 Tax=Methylotenera mobilis (strain JLW8 / ATCC BAA-1282 / DSM 17540) TaxID=583345 RepID=C6WVN1_METML|nr:type II secretion system F family protein [Methylotenera mobilis]ACT47980.1 type II secretion system protein [Methylotenera mobilis JLW8]
MKFELKVAQGEEVRLLALEASNAVQARAIAESQGLSVLNVKSVGMALFTVKSSAPKFNLMLFSQELLALLESGLSLVEAIEALAEKEQQAESKAILNQVMGALFEGLPLSTALEKVPQVFTPLYIALIRASERTGDMVQALARHVAYQTQIDAVRKKIITASIYPVLLIIVGGLVVLFLLGYVVPKFSTIYESASTDLPWMSQLLLSWGQLLQEHGSEVFLVFVSGVVMLALILSRPFVRAAIMAKVWQIPALGETMRIYQLARFYRTLGMLLRGGIPLVTAMSMVSSLLQPLLRVSLDKVSFDVREGKPMSVAMEQHGMTTSISIRMLRVGERTGQMGEMMERIGAFYDEEIGRKVEWLTKLLEPVLMIIIGLVVGLVVVLMYMPIFELAGNIQ